MIDCCAQRAAGRKLCFQQVRLRFRGCTAGQDGDEGGGEDLCFDVEQVTGNVSTGSLAVVPAMKRTRPGAWPGRGCVSGIALEDELQGELICPHRTCADGAAVFGQFQFG